MGWLQNTNWYKNREIKREHAIYCYFHNLPISKFQPDDVEYANSWYLNYDDHQLAEMEEIMFEKLDYEPFIRDIYSPDQMRVLRYGLRYKIDITPLENSKLTVPEMRAILTNDVISMKKLHKLGLNDGQMEELCKVIILGLDLQPFLNLDYGPKRMMYIRIFISNKLDPKYMVYFKDLGYKEEQLELILKGIVQGYDPKFYDNKRFTPDMIRLILRGIKHRIDITEYNDPFSTYSQMYHTYHRLLEEANIIDYDEEVVEGY